MNILKEKKIDLYMPITVLGLVILGLIFGSVFDLSISKAIYTERNFVSYFTEYVGTIPAAFTFIISSIMLFLYFSKRNDIKFNSVYKYLSLLLTPLAGAFWGYDALKDYLPKTMYAIAIGVAVSIPLGYLLYLDLKRKYSDSFARDALVIILAYITSIVLTFGLKSLIARPRFYYLLNENPDFSLFRNWFDFSTNKTIYPNVIKKTFIQSWPSGHSSFSALLYLLLLTPFSRKNKRRHLTFACVTIYALFIMLGRILDGHHYLSDVSSGFFIGSLSAFIYMIFIPKDLFIKNKNIKKEELTNKIDTSIKKENN